MSIPVEVICQLFSSFIFGNLVCSVTYREKWWCHKQNMCDQGLMGMQVGGIRTLFVPAHLAYGERSMGAHIKPGSNLRFEIELLEVLTRDE